MSLTELTILRTPEWEEVATDVDNHAELCTTRHATDGGALMHDLRRERKCQVGHTLSWPYHTKPRDTSTADYRTVHTDRCSGQPAIQNTFTLPGKPGEGINKSPDTGRTLHWPRYCSGYGAKKLNQSGGSWSVRSDHHFTQAVLYHMVLMSGMFLISHPYNGSSSLVPSARRNEVQHTVPSTAAVVWLRICQRINTGDNQVPADLLTRYGFYSFWNLSQG